MLQIPKQKMVATTPLVVGCLVGLVAVATATVGAPAAPEIQQFLLSATGGQFTMGLFGLSTQAVPFPATVGCCVFSAVFSPPCLPCGIVLCLPSPTLEPQIHVCEFQTYPALAMLQTCHRHTLIMRKS